MNQYDARCRDQQLARQAHEAEAEVVTPPPAPEEERAHGHPMMGCRTRQRAPDHEAAEEPTAPQGEGAHPMQETGTRTLLFMTESRRDIGRCRMRSRGSTVPIDAP
jgi:hypothetical protein